MNESPNVNILINEELQQTSSMPSCFNEIFYMLERGEVLFEKGYLSTLGEMQRNGLIQAEIYKDGTTIVRRIL